MRISTIGFLALQATGILAAAASKDAADCGELGVLDWSQVNIPTDVDHNDLRKCRDHPETLTTRNENKGSNLLQKRECWDGKSFGCSNTGWCWMRCGGTKWCWLARDKGYGDWLSCNNDDQCIAAFQIDQIAGCGKGNCADCGCSCH